MANSTWQQSRRRLFINFAPDKHLFTYNDQVRDQCKWRWYQSMRYHWRILLILLGFLTIPLLEAASSSIDYGSLTWSTWNKIYTLAATDSVELRKIYHSGPRVRAKILVSTHISLNELQAGEAIFREQIRDIVQVETIDRVQMEYLQTEAYSDAEQEAYYVALGVSALPPPQSSGNSYDSVLMLLAIETERQRISENLKYGKMLTTGNMTIDSLTLFGVPMKLVDIVLDGEAFAQIYLKPWLGVQLSVASTESVNSGISSSDTEHYATDRDAFQDLRLRFLLALQLESLQVRVSDIIVHSPLTLLPFNIYYADAGVLEIEIHVHDMKYAVFVEKYLLSDNNSSTTPNNVIAEAFNEMEPQWKLLAMDVDTSAGELFSPVANAPIGSDTKTDSSIASELTFEMYNISLMQLERSKWPVLDYMRATLAPVVSSRVRFGRTDFPSASSVSNLALYNDGGEDDVVTEDGFATDSIFDPINAVNWTLSFKVEPETTDTFDSAMLANYITTMRSTVETGLLLALECTDTTATSTTRSTTFQGVSDWTDSDSNDADTMEPFVSFILTIQVKPLEASGTILESPNFFQLHHIRSALVLLLQQVGISNDQISIMSANVIDRPIFQANSGLSWHRLVLFKYRATISDESQRRGIRSVVFSHRLAFTISMYSGSTLTLIEREIDLHADGSPIWPQHFPGVFDVVPEVNNISDGFVTSSSPLVALEETFVYDFNDPDPSSSSGTIVDATDVCASDGTSTSTAGLCIKLRFTGTVQVTPIFLRTLQSLDHIVSSSISLPPASAALNTSDASFTYKAPWVLVGDQSNDGDTLWIFNVDTSSSTSKYQSVRLTFEAVGSMQDLSATTPFTLDLELNFQDLSTVPVVRRHQFGDLAVVATSDQPEPAFIFAELPELADNGAETTGVTITLNLDESRLGGLYSASLLNEVAPTCSACTVLLATCNSLECRAFSACTSVLLDADLTLFSTMLQDDAIGTSVDASRLLKNCLNPSDGTVWSSAIHDILVSSYKCLWQKSCPLAYSTTLNRQIVLDYTQGEQVLEFELVNGFASLSFTLDSGEGESTYEFMEDFSTNATAVTTQLDTMLTDMYRDALSNVATVKSALTTTEDAVNGVVTTHLTIHYLFLGRLPLPFVEITQSGNSDTASVDVTNPKETLNLRVIPID